LEQPRHLPEPGSGLWGSPATARRVPSDDAQRAMSAGVMSSDRAVAAPSSTPPSNTASSFSSV
ncbi:MAG: hypothetical protein AAF333_13140, partial [Planctomycetota bacterium]